MRSISSLSSRIVCISVFVFTLIALTGNPLVPSTYLGSGQGGYETVRSIAVDSIGNAYGTGTGCALCTILNSAVNSARQGPAIKSATATPAATLFAQFSQQGPKLLGTGAVGNAQHSHSVPLSANGNTTIVGVTNDKADAGAVLVSTSPPPDVWTSGGPCCGGDVRAMAIHPSTPSTLYVGAYRSGIFKSTDSAGTWVAVNVGLANLDVFALAINPADSGTIYAGTFGGGVFKSTDSGSTWTAANTGLTIPFVSSLAINPATPATIYAGTGFGGGGGVFKSTDSGATWATANTGLTNLNVNALGINPSIPATLYAATRGGVFKSVDAGGTWAAASTGLTAASVNAIAINPMTPAILYVADGGGGVFKSTDSGGSWAPARTGMSLAVQALAINPTTPTTLYAGGYDGSILYKSTDSGGSWAAANTGLTIGGGVWTMAINPATPAVLYAGGFHGISKSTNSGGNWADAYTGLTALAVNALAISPHNPSTLYAGTYRGGIFKSINSGSMWAAANTGLTGNSLIIQALVIDPTTPATVYAGTYFGVVKCTDSGGTWAAANTGLTSTDFKALAINPLTPTTLYAGTYGGGVFKSTNSAGTWMAANAGLTNLNISAMAINPTTPSVLYAGTSGGGIFKSTDSGGTWAAANTGMTNLSIFALAIDPTTPTTLYAGMQAGGVFKSTDSGSTWTPANTGLTSQFVSSLAINPTTPTTLYAGGYGVFKSTDSGGTWTAASTELSTSTVYALALDPTGSTTIYAGLAGRGVWQSTGAPTSAPTPVVFSITPTAPASGPSDQDIFISGSNFKPSLTVEISSPGGGVTTLSGEQIQNVTDSSFILRATLNSPGSWSIKVKNPDNQESASFAFTVSSGGPIPFITSISPNPPTANGADQNVIVTGGNFQNGLRINATFPSGGIATLQGTGQIQNVTATSFKLKITLNTDGAWKIRVINPDNTQSAQFTFNVQPSGPPPTGLPTSVLSPVIGPLRVTSSNLAIADGKWEFNQHKTGNHTPTGGIYLSNDTFAWDANLYTATNSNADAGKAVFATAAGQVVSYVSTPPGGGPGAVLIAHPNTAAPVWFSGYLHMTNVGVTLNQVVDSTTLIGEVVPAGAPNDHLHFVVYSGTNTRGNLQSFNTVINERSSTTPPTISSITPSTVVQGDQLQSITINGSNFASDSMVEGETPTGRSFPVNPQLITSVTASTITANVTFQFPGTYKFRVINRSTGAISSGSCPQICVSVTAAAFRTPVILIPGIMGSKLSKWNGTTATEELWPGGFLTDHRELKNNVEEPTDYREIPQRQVVATGIVRSVKGRNFYGPIIDWLTGADGGYKLSSEPYPTHAICNPSSTNSNDTLFVFPYDWRNSNVTSAKDLYDFVQCIKRIRGNPPNFKVHILAHSMGGLVARRYILDHPGAHYVNRMITLGTPWFGSPDVVNTLENGGGSWFSLQSLFVILPSTIRDIAPYIKGAHELIPSEVYTDIFASVDTRGVFPFGEDGWNDYDDDPNRNSRYDFGRLRGAMNKHYSNFYNAPGDTTYLFHSRTLQDDWRNDNTGVSYFHLIGSSTGTVGSIIAKRSWWGEKKFETVETLGDGTVPDISALKQRGNIDYNPISPPFFSYYRFSYFAATDHSELVSKRNTYPYIKSCLTTNQDPNDCLLSPALRNGIQNPADLVVEPYYRLRIDNSESVIITDSFGNTTDPLSTSLDAGLQNVKVNVTGEKNLDAWFPLDQIYKVVLKTPLTPLSITVTKSDGQTITQAIRYVDIMLPPNVLALLEITPQGVSALIYDSDGDGTYDTLVNPTISVTGDAAQDTDPPSVAISASAQGNNSLVTITTSDTGSGVQATYYSTDGTNFQPYTNPFNVDRGQVSVIYAFADDNVANRSGLETLALTTAISGQLMYANGTTPANSVTMTLTGLSGFTPMTSTTDISGNYSFTNVPIGDDYTVTPSKTGDANGIESFDASFVARYAAGLDVPTANQRIAADADGDGILTSFDAALIARYVAGLPGSGIVGTWRFSPTSRSYSALSANQTGQNFTAILVGDTSGNWLPAIPSGVGGNANKAGPLVLAAP